jgi:hypothetical protein
MHYSAASDVYQPELLAELEALRARFELQVALHRA